MARARIGVNFKGVRAVGLLLCAASFLLGTALAISSFGGDAAGLSPRLDAYRAELTEGENSPGASFTEPVCFIAGAFLAGLSVFGVLVAPCLCFLKGFLLTLAASVFVRHFGAGSSGAMLLLLGTGAAITVPCFFVVSVDAFCVSTSLIRGRRGDGLFRRSFLRFIFCLCLAILAVFINRFLVSHFIQAVFSA